MTEKDLIKITLSPSGKLTFGVMAENMDRYLDCRDNAREELRAFLQRLSEECGFGIYPFQTTRKEEHGPVDWS